MTDKHCSLLDLCQLDSEDDSDAVIFDDGKNKQILTYRQMTYLSSQVSEVLCDYKREGQVIGVCMEPQLITPAVLIGILKSDAAFYNFDLDALQLVSYALSQVGCQVILTDTRNLQLLQNLVTQLDGTIKPLKFSEYPMIHLIDLQGVQRKVHPNKLAYCITTSGTTGQPKIVKVPHACIVPNIIHLREIYGLSSIDLAMLCSPLTFDPSIVEIFTTLSVGATLLVVPPVVKMSPDLLLDTAYKRNKVTIMQATPTLLSRFGSVKLQNSLLSDQTSLRVMSLGGEEFPDVCTILSYKSAGNQTKFINLYGITEVSVWATYYKVTEEDLSHSRPVPLGVCLKDTIVEVRDELGHPITQGTGELYIGGYKRQCLVITSDVDRDRWDDSVLNLRATGDIVRRDQDGALYYLHRKDQQMKRNGKRTNLDEIRQVLLKCDRIQDCVTLMFDNRLVTFVTVSEKSVSVQSDVNRQLMQCLPSHSVPDDIIVIDALPMTTHGKMDFKQLRNLYKYWRQKNNEIVHYSTDFLRELWKDILHVEADKIDNHSNFIQLGGDSLTAVQILDCLEQILKVQLAYFLDKLINGTFRDCDEYVQGIINTSNDGTLVEDKCIGEVIDNNHIDTTEMFEFSSTENVDNNSSVKDSITYKPYRNKRKNEFDKHSAKDMEDNNEVNGEVSDGSIIKRKCELSVKVFPFIFAISKGNQFSICKTMETDDNTAIKANQSLDQQVNTHVSDTFKCTRDTELHDRKNTVAINHMFSANKDTFTVSKDEKCDVKLNEGSINMVCDADMIYSDPSTKLNNAESVNRLYDLFPKDERQLYQTSCDREAAVDINETLFKLEVDWRFDTGKCVDASPLIAITSHKNGVVFIGSHSHKFFAITMETGQCLWEVTLGDRIEATACLSLCGDFVIVGCYDGSIYSLDCKTGSVWWKFQTGSQVKCSPVVDEYSGLVYVGSHDQSVYCLDIRGKVVVWRNNLKSGSVFSSPAINNDGSRLFVATLGGKVFCLDKIKGCELWMFDCKKPVFSSLTLMDNTVLIGCADSCLYNIGLDGNLIWKYSTQAPIFSTPTVFLIASSQKIQGACHHGVFGSKNTAGACQQIGFGSQLQKTDGACQQKWFGSQHQKTDGACQQKVFGSQYNEEGACQQILFGTQNQNTAESCQQKVFGSQHQTTKQIVFGSHDNMIYCLSHTGTLRWKTKVQSHVYSTPFYCNIRVSHNIGDVERNCQLSNQAECPSTTCTDTKLHIQCRGPVFGSIGLENKKDFMSTVPVIVFCCTSGVLYIVDAETGHILCNEIVPGELFSSPVLYENSIFVGCRDNNVYKFNLTVQMNSKNK